MLLLGIDLGTSSVKVSVIDTATRLCLASAQYPESEADIISEQPGWAEQSPDEWWEQVKQAILKCHNSGAYHPHDISSIGIAYQMHGLVLVDKDQHVLRNSIIWCDSRAVEIGERAFDEIGNEQCLSHLLNSPGNFTAAKLAWVKQNEPEVYERIHRIMLPGDFIAMRLTGEITTTMSALSEGIFWDFKEHGISKDILAYFGFDRDLFPVIRPVFSNHGYIRTAVAARLSLREGIPVTYKAGDQLNNAFALNVSRPGEVAATAGTSGVIYGISNRLDYDIQSRINSFAHVNHGEVEKRIGILLCINGAGICNRWIRTIAGGQQSYESLNAAAADITVGSEGLILLPFGNGAERMLNNRIVGAHFHNLDFNVHTNAHLFRSVQEGIACSFRYGLDIMRQNGIEPEVIRAGRTNMFLSRVFTEAFVNLTGVPVELYRSDGSIGAALGAGVGCGVYTGPEAAFEGEVPLLIIEPGSKPVYEALYQQWKERLQLELDNEPQSQIKYDQILNNKG